MSEGLILLTGATGYVGGRLLKSLEQEGRKVRCLARRPEYLAYRVAGETEVVGGDLLNENSLKKVFKNVETAYYLVHSMSARGIFEDRDRQAAENFAKAALEEGVQRIAIEDVLQYLVAALDKDLAGSTIYEIGGADKVSYDGIMREYARLRRLKRLMIPLPFLTPTMSSAWVAFFTPLYRKIARRLIRGVRNATVVLDLTAQEEFDIQPRGIREAIERAIINEDDQFASTHWSDALGSKSLQHQWWGEIFGARLVDTYARRLPYPPNLVFRPIQCIGGENGWYGHNWLWQIRGHLDRLFGGVGLRRGRRDQCDLRPGDAIDFWRVQIYDPTGFLLLFAEMRMPGRAWLQFEVDTAERGSLLRMTLIFDPVGVWGRLYWYGMYPFHFMVFNGIFKKIIKIIDKQTTSVNV